MASDQQASDAFCHLHVHTSKSFRDGLAPVSELVEHIAGLGQPGCACTNHGNLFDAADFVKACEAHDIKPVLGMEAYEAVPHTWDPAQHAETFKQPWDPQAAPRYFHLTLWVLNEEGWRNLSALHSLSFTKPYKPKNQPLIDRAHLETHSEGLAVGLGCIQSRTNHAIRRGGDGYEQAKWYAEVFEDRCWIEVMANLDDQVALLNDQRKLAKRLGRPTVATNDVHYIRQEDGVEGGSHHVLVQARRWKKKEGAEESQDKSDEGYGRWYGSDEFYAKSREQMVATGGLLETEIDESLAVLDAVDFNFSELTRPAPPQAPVPAPGEDPAFDKWLALTP